MGKVFLHIVVLSLALFTGGCSSIMNALSGESKDKNAVDADLLATYFDGPKVRPGVALQISVTASGLTGQAAKQYFVDADGYITMELVGQIKCDGLTLVGLQQKIAAAYKEYFLAAAYKEYFLDPHVTATFIYQAGGGMVSPWGTVTVLGEVNKPGPVDVPSTMDLRVTRALQLAGGATGLADKANIRVTHCDKDGKQTKTVVDLIEIGKEGRPDKDVLLQAGDVVWVPMSWY